MKALQVPFDSAWILKNRRKIKKELLADGTPRIEKKIAVLGGSTTNDIVSILELFLLVLLWEKKKSFADRGWGFLCILVAVVTAWRTEAVYYFVLFPLLLVILYAGLCEKKKLLRVICGYLICALCLLFELLVQLCCLLRIGCFFIFKLHYLKNHNNKKCNNYHCDA